MASLVYTIPMDTIDAETMVLSFARSQGYVGDSLEQATEVARVAVNNYIKNHIISQLAKDAASAAMTQVEQSIGVTLAGIPTTLVVQE